MEAPYVFIGQVSTFLYFFILAVVFPLLDCLESKFYLYISKVK